MLTPRLTEENVKNKRRGNGDEEDDRQEVFTVAVGTFVMVMMMDVTHVNATPS
jgi:hypothetical protein